MLGDAVFYLMEPVDGFNAGAGLPPLHASDAAVRYGMACRWPTPQRNLGPWTTWRWAWAISASRTDSWNAKCRGGWNWIPTRSSTTTPGRRSR